MPRRKDAALMRRHALAVAVIASLLAAAPASADDDKKATRARAAEQFDAGVGAFKKKDFEGAATHFEAANAAFASSTALRQAIRARVEAGQGARAATLSAIALVRYASDAGITKLARDTIEKYEPILHKVHVICA
jgi:outer membrane protein assembly factor BamD (BamD/ComL family)